MGIYHKTKMSQIYATANVMVIISNLLSFLADKKQSLYYSNHGHHMVQPRRCWGWTECAASRYQFARLRPWHIFKISLALVGSVAGDIHTVGQTQGVQDALVTLVILNHGLADVERAHHVLILQLTNTESVHHQCAFFLRFVAFSWPWH